MLRYLGEHPEKRRALDGMRLLVGGAAPPESMIRDLQKHGARFIQGWGMTETSPLATISSGAKSTMRHLTEDERTALLVKQGVPVPFIDIRTVIADEICPNDGDTMENWKFAGHGSLRLISIRTVDRISGPQMAGSGPETSQPSIETVTCRITDCTKDLIKSGGEWISSVDLENALMSHPQLNRKPPLSPFRIRNGKNALWPSWF